MSDNSAKKKVLDDQIATLSQDIKRRKDGLEKLNASTDKLAQSGLSLAGHPAMEKDIENENKLISAKENELKKLFNERVKLLGK